MSLLNDALKRAQESQRPNAPADVASMPLRSVEMRRKERPMISRLLVVVIFLLLAVGIGFIGLAMMGRMTKKANIPPQAARVEPVQVAMAPAHPASTAPMVAKITPVVPVAAEPASEPAPVAIAEPAPVIAPAPVAVAEPAPTVAPTPVVVPEPAPVAVAEPAPVAVAPVAVVEPPPAVSPKPVPVAVVAAVAPVAVMALPPLALPDTLHVQGITFDPVRPCAIVSGKTVSVGDMVKGVKVMAINRDSVTFGSNGQTNLLFVGQ